MFICINVSIFICHMVFIWNCLWLCLCFQIRSIMEYLLNPVFARTFINKNLDQIQMYLNIYTYIHVYSYTDVQTYISIYTYRLSVYVDLFIVYNVFRCIFVYVLSTFVFVFVFCISYFVFIHSLHVMMFTILSVPLCSLLNVILIDDNHLFLSEQN